MAMATRVTTVRKCGMPVPDFTVTSTTSAITSRTTGITSDFTSTTQCWWVLRTSFSPGRRSLAIAAPTLSHLEEHDQRGQREVRAVRESAFQRAIPDDDTDRGQAGQEHAVEQRLDRRQRAEKKTHERGELDVPETERFGFEDERSKNRDEQKEKTRRDARRQSIPPRLVEQAHHEREGHRRKDHAVEDETVLEVEEDDLHEHEPEDAVQQQEPRHAQLVAERREDDRTTDYWAPHLPRLVAGL